MKQDYTISRFRSTELAEVIEFVLDQNNKHHKKTLDDSFFRMEVENLVKEESSISNEESCIYVARNQSGKIIGSIRTCQWNRKGRLPMHIFVPDNLTPDKQAEYIADALDRICDQDVEAPEE